MVRPGGKKKFAMWHSLLLGNTPPEGNKSGEGERERERPSERMFAEIAASDRLTDNTLLQNVKEN